MRRFETENERAAAEYLTAFIRLLYSRGKSAYEIEDKLEIDSDLIYKLIPTYKAELEKRNLEYIEKLKKEGSPIDPVKMLREKRIFLYQDTWRRHTQYLKNVDSWQRRQKFTNPIDYHIGKKKRYTGSDIEVLLKLSTAASATIKPVIENYNDRELLPVYKLRIINYIADGYALKELSEKFNCSELAIKQTLEEREIVYPVSEISIEKRIIRAVEDGYSFEQLAARFKYTAEEKLTAIIKEIRITPALEEGANFTE